MPKVAHPGEHHGHAALVGSVYHFLIAHRAAVAEGEEGVTGDHRALQSELAGYGLVHRPVKCDGAARDCSEDTL
jgi:hypothetical protein